jgi:hypothetical protein
MEILGQFTVSVLFCFEYEMIDEVQKVNNSKRNTQSGSFRTDYHYSRVQNMASAEKLVTVLHVCIDRYDLFASLIRQ